MKNNLKIVFALILIFSLVPFAQEPLSPEAETQIQTWEQELSEVYSELYLLRQELDANPSPAIRQKFARLSKRATQLEINIRKTRDGITMDPEQADDFSEGMPAKKEAKGNKEHRKQLKAKSKELKKLNKEIESMDNEVERLPLEIYRDQLTEEIAELKAKTKAKQPKKPNKKDRQPLSADELLDELFMEDEGEFKPKAEGKHKPKPPFHQKSLHKQREPGKKRHQRPQRGFFSKQKAKDPVVRENEGQQKKLESEVQKLVRTYRRQAGENTEGQKQEIRELLNQLFELRQELREYEVKMIEKEAQERRSKLEKRKENKEMIVDRYLKELIGESDEWDW